MNEQERGRLDSEFLAVNAVRELIRLATENDSSQATYNRALELGGQIFPEILGPDVSLLRRYRESPTAREFRQMAEAKTRTTSVTVSPVELLEAQVGEYKEMLESSRTLQRTDQLKKRLMEMENALRELDPTRHSEHQVIWRDVFHVERDVPELEVGQGYRDFALPDNSVLRIRVTHPERAESISGADVIYERHAVTEKTVSIVGVQYKIWEDKSLSLNDERLQKQLATMKSFFCDQGLCQASAADHPFRFPFCSAFLRPTDRLQVANQELRSSGEHLPICQIDNVKSHGARGAEQLQYANIRRMSLPGGMFETLFAAGRLGSRTLTYDELPRLYREFGDMVDPDRILIHAQDFGKVDASEATSLFE